MRSWTGGFEVLAGGVGGGVGAGVFVVAESDGDAVGGAWGGLLGEFASEVLTHFADGQGYKVGEDLQRWWRRGRRAGPGVGGRCRLQFWWWVRAAPAARTTTWRA